MGVFGLFQFCNEHVETASQRVNLTELAAEHKAQGKPPLTLTADGSAFFHYIFQPTSTSWEWALGGNYPEMAAAMQRWVLHLRNSGINLSVFMDPPRAKEEKEKNVYERKRRFKQRCSNIERVMQLLRDGEELEEWEDQEVRVDWQPPQLARDQALTTLRGLGVVVMSCEQSADEELSSLLNLVPGSYAIIGSDSDFFVMEGVRFVPLEHLVFEGDQVWARVFTPESVAACLGISAKRMPELAFLCGNDLTCEFMDKHKIASSLKIQTVHSRTRGWRCPPEQVAAFLAEQPDDVELRAHPVLAQLALSDPLLAAALAENAAFYAHAEAPMDAERERSLLLLEMQGQRDLAQSVEELLERGIRDCSLPGWLLRVHKRREMYLGAKVEAMWAKVIYAMVAPSRLQAAASPALPTLRRHRSHPPARAPPRAVPAPSQEARPPSSGAEAEEATAKGKAKSGAGGSEKRRRRRSSLGDASEAGRGGEAAGASGQEEALPFVVTEYVREGAGRKHHRVEAVAAEVLEAAVGTASIIELRRRSEAERRQALQVLVHLSEGDTAESGRQRAAEASTDALTALPAAHHLAHTSGPPAATSARRSVPLWGVCVLLRYAVVLQATAKARGVGVVWSAWDFECMLRVVVLLSAGAEVGHLPPYAPLARAAEVSSLFLSSVTAVATLSQLLRVEHLLPEPAAMFSGRVWAHLHASTPAGAALVSVVEESPLRELVCAVRDAVLGAFGDADELLGKLEVEGGFGRRRTQALEVEILGLEQAAAVGAVGEQLPIDEHRQSIVDSVQAHQVVCIQGETGSGKSSMVPQILVEDAQKNGVPIKVMVTQPRRIAAVTLARRVASQRGEVVGKSVGYRIGHGDHVDSGGAITFVTVGYALQLLAHNPARLSRYTHMVLDEVHERTMEGDLLNLLLKKLMAKSSCKTKLVVMSATLQKGLFGEYFTRESQPILPPIFVGACRFPVQEMFLDELLRSLPGLQGGSHIREMERRFAKLVKKQDESGGVLSRLPAEFSMDSQHIMVNLVLHLAQPSSCILCFLPGIGEIASVQDDLEQADSKTPLQILVLHSLVPREAQEAAIAPAQAEYCKVILSTNIAQTSVTIPDVRFVIDTGIHRSILYDAQRRLQSLLCTWCSQASAKQRSGRAGRVAPGTILYLFTRDFHAKCMPKFDDPEMLRVPLDKTVLRVKLLLRRFGRTSDLLAEALSPPQPTQVQEAVRALYQAGALTREDEDSEVSQLGRLAVDLPVELALVKLVLLARAFGCLNDGIVMAGALSMQDLFLMPSTVFVRDQGKYMKELQANTASRMDFDAGCCSEPLMLLTAYKQWLGSDRHPRWAKNKNLSHARLKQLDLLVAELAAKLQTVLDATGEDAALLVRLARLHGMCVSGAAPKREALQDLFSANLPLLRFLLAGAFAPTFLDCIVRGRAGPKAKASGKEGPRAKSAEAPAEEEERISGVEPKYLLTLGKIPSKCNKEELLLPALKAAGLPVRADGYKKLGMTEAVVAVEAHAKDALGTERDKNKMGWGKEGRVVEDSSFLAKMARILWASNRRKLALPLPAPADAVKNKKEEAKVLEIGKVSVDMEVDYMVSATAIQDGEDSTPRALPYWRAPVANLSDLSGSKDRWAVALSMLGTEREELVRVVGLTILPEGIFAKISQLVFCPRDRKLRVRANESISAFDAVMIGKGKISLEPTALAVNDFGVINLIRRFVSDAVAGVGSTSGVFSLAHVLEQLMQLLLRRAPSEQRRADGNVSGKTGAETSRSAGGDVEGSKSGAVEAVERATQRWIPCCLEESRDFLPQIRMDFEAAQREYQEQLRQQAGSEAKQALLQGLAEPRNGTVATQALPRIGAEESLAAKAAASRHASSPDTPAQDASGKGDGDAEAEGRRTNLSAMVLRATSEQLPELPEGLVRVGGEKAREGAVGWVTLCLVVDLSDRQVVPDRFGMLLRWFKKVLDNEVRALLVLSPVLDGETRRLITLAAARLSLSARCVGGSLQRRLLFFTHHSAIKHIPVIGDVSISSSGCFSVPAEPPSTARPPNKARQVILTVPGKGLYHIPLQHSAPDPAEQSSGGAGDAVPGSPAKDAGEPDQRRERRGDERSKDVDVEVSGGFDGESTGSGAVRGSGSDAPSGARALPEPAPTPTALREAVMDFAQSLLDMVARLQPAILAVLEAGPKRGVALDAIPREYVRVFGAPFPLSRFNQRAPLHVTLAELAELLSGVEVAEVADKKGAPVLVLRRLAAARLADHPSPQTPSAAPATAPAAASERAPPSPSLLPRPLPALLQHTALPSGTSAPPDPPRSAAAAPASPSSSLLALVPPAAFTPPSSAACGLPAAPPASGASTQSQDEASGEQRGQGQRGADTEAAEGRESAAERDKDKARPGGSRLELLGTCQRRGLELPKWQHGKTDGGLWHAEVAVGGAKGVGAGVRRGDAVEEAAAMAAEALESGGGERLAGEHKSATEARAGRKGAGEGGKGRRRGEALAEQRRDDAATPAHPAPAAQPPT